MCTYSDKKDFVIVLVKETKAAANNNGFVIIYRLTRELADGRDFSDSPVRDISGRSSSMLISTVLNRITYSEVH